MKRLNETNSVWNSFGILKHVSNDNRMIRVQNEDGDIRMMSVRKYAQSARNVEAKARTMIGEEVKVRTSQATDNWDANKWFSGIELA